jgi:predicted nucleotidyltransferase
MEGIASLIRKLRVERGYPLRKVAAFLDIDQAILSKMERGIRKIKKDQVIKLARFFDYDEKEMIKIYLSDKILYELGEEENALEALKIAEDIIAYKTASTTDRTQVIEKLKEVISTYPEITKAWMYGSFARNEDKPGSDIDIAVKSDHGFSYFDLAGLQHRLEVVLKRKVDVGFIDSFKPRILVNVKQDLIQFYERQGS